jgi:hypothetical protein
MAAFIKVINGISQIELLFKKHPESDAGAFK